MGSSPSTVGWHGSTDEIDRVIDRYIATWNETEPGRRRDLIARTWTEDASYVDPLVAVEGHEAIDASIAATQAQFPGLAFRLAGRSTPTTMWPVSRGNWSPASTRTRSWWVST